MDNNRPASDNVVLGPTDGVAMNIGGFGVRFRIGAARSGGGFALVEHPLEPRTLAGPLHTHTREDEYSFIVQGQIGLQVGDTVVNAGPGELVVKPRGIPHAFWNASDRRATMLEIISPAGFERYFAELAKVFSRPGPRDEAALGELQSRYGLTMDFASIPALAQRYGLNLER